MDTDPDWEGTLRESVTTAAPRTTTGKIRVALLEGRSVEAVEEQTTSRECASQRRRKKRESRKLAENTMKLEKNNISSNHINNAADDELDNLNKKRKNPSKNTTVTTSLNKYS